MSETVRDLCFEALEELGVQAPGESFPPERAARALVRYNRLLDAWNAERGAVYADQFLTYTLTGANPETIGPSGGTITGVRPVSIEGASRWMDADTKAPIAVRDAEWWNNQRVPALDGDFPTDLYYEPAYPLGKLHFWPAGATCDVELWTRVVLAQVTLGTAFALPPGYKRAHVLTLAEECAAAFGVAVSAKLEQDARTARATAFGNNRRPPRLATADAGMPRSGASGRTFNVLTREM